MKPLLSVISYNRTRETIATLSALLETGAFEQAQVVIFDNGSTDGTADAIRGLFAEGLAPYGLVFYGRNIGCPRALNSILHHYRKPGQHFIKVDNDVRLLTNDWVRLLCDFPDAHPDVAMVGPWYKELETGYQGRVLEKHESWWRVYPIIGHCVMHRGAFLDRTGFFDVLAPDHLYGFEDLLMAHRAGALGFKCAVSLDVQMENIQRKNSLDSGMHDGERREEHISRLRPEYNRRTALISALSGLYHVGSDGQKVKVQ